MARLPVRRMHHAAQMGELTMTHLVLLVLSLCCFMLAAWQDRSPSWNRLMSAGAAFFVASTLSW